MGLLKFFTFEIGLVLFISFLSAVVSVFGFGYFDPKFDPWGNVELRLLLSSIAAFFVMGVIGGILFVVKKLPVDPKAATNFGIFFGVYLEAYRILVDICGWSTGSMGLPIFFMVIVPVCMGAVFFLKSKLAGIKSN